MRIFDPLEVVEYIDLSFALSMVEEEGRDTRFIDGI